MSKNANLVHKIAQLALEKKAQDIVILDIRGIIDMFDYFVILNGTSSRHLGVVTDFIVDELKKEKIRPQAREGNPETGWILLDYGEVIVHIFSEETRQFYQIERLFKDAKVEKIEDNQD